MSKTERRTITVIAIIVLAVIIWLLLRHSQTAQSIIKQNVPWLEPIMGGSGSTYNIGGLPGYVPANMPIVTSSAGKCDSMTPCIFCNIPNHTYPSPPIKQSAAPYQMVSANAPMPASLTFGSQQPSYIQGSWTGEHFLGYTPEFGSGLTMGTGSR